jgi:glycolate oxidase FAD binding subunit
MPTIDSLLLQITKRIQAATAERTPLRIQGGGSKDFYGQSLEGELLDVSGWRGIVSYEPSELVITARAGTPLAELEATLAEQGQCLAFEPPHFQISSGDAPARLSSPLGAASVGGMVACGLSGPARASVGAVRDYVLGVKLINGRGEHLTFGGQVIKNVAGYDVSRLMVGAMGTLGLLTEISLKVLPVAAAEATLMCAGVAQQRALDLLNRWGAQALPLNASCWVFDGDAKPPRDLLFVRLRGAAAAVQAAGPRLMADLQAQGGQAVLMDNAQAGPDWAACRDLRLPFFAPPDAPSGSTSQMALWRLSVPQTAPVLDLPYAQLIEWHGGLRWLWAPVEAQAQVRQAVAAVAGTATLFIAVGADSTGATARFSPMDPVLAGIHQRLKAEFDPAGIFNRGRLYPEF